MKELQRRNAQQAKLRDWLVKRNEKWSKIRVELKEQRYLVDKQNYVALGSSKQLICLSSVSLGSMSFYRNNNKYIYTYVTSAKCC